MEGIMRFLLTLVIALAGGVCCAEEIHKVSLPVEVKNEMVEASTPEIQNLQWNRWTSENFTVCALNDAQAQYLHKHLELVKVWVFTRWGLYDVPFSGECRIICVDDAALFKKLFGLDKSLTEIRKTADGKIKMSVIFMLTDNKPSVCVPMPLTEICLTEFEQRYSKAFGWWVFRGMTMLNGSIYQIKEQMVAADANLPAYYAKGILEMSKQEWVALPADKQVLYDRRAMALCLMLRKEFGQDSFLQFLVRTANRGDPETALRETFNFKSYGEFDATFQRYILDLSSDIRMNKTPNSYLQIREK
jgi:hypothetical protein